MPVGDSPIFGVGEELLQKIFHTWVEPTSFGPNKINILFDAEDVAQVVFEAFDALVDEGGLVLGGFVVKRFKLGHYLFKACALFVDQFHQFLGIDRLVDVFAAAEDLKNQPFLDEAIDGVVDVAAVDIGFEGNSADSSFSRFQQRFINLCFVGRKADLGENFRIHKTFFRPKLYHFTPIGVNYHHVVLLATRSIYQIIPASLNINPINNGKYTRQTGFEPTAYL